MVVLACAVRLPSQEPQASLGILAIKQDIPQYNAVLDSIRRHTTKSKKKIDVDVINISHNPAMPDLSIPQRDHDIILSIGTNSLMTALTRFSNKSHVFGMVLTVDTLRLQELVKQSNKTINGVLMLVEPRAYIEYAMQIQKNIDRIGLVYQASSFDGYVEEIRSAGVKLGVDIAAERVAKKEDFLKHFNSVVKSRIDAFLIMPDFNLYDARSLERVLINTYNRGIPCIGPSESFVTSGALWAFELEPEIVGRQIAERIVNSGAKGQIRIDYYSPARVCINTNVAANLEIDIPYHIRKEAKLIDLRRPDED